MKEIEILNSGFARQAEMLLAPAIKAGFPSPAEDYIHDSLDFNRDIVKHPESTFYGRISGDSMIDAGFKEGDLAVIDRSREPADGDVVVAYINNEFTIKYLDLSHKGEGYIELRPANAKYRPIRIDETDEFEVWGVVSYVIHQL